jgi:ActR/RegA family two-component response regulator
MPTSVHFVEQEGTQNNFVEHNENETETANERCMRKNTTYRSLKQQSNSCV